MVFTIYDGLFLDYLPLRRIGNGAIYEFYPCQHPDDQPPHHATLNIAAGGSGKRGIVTRFGVRHLQY